MLFIKIVYYSNVFSAQNKACVQEISIFLRLIEIPLLIQLKTTIYIIPLSYSTVGCFVLKSAAYIIRLVEGIGNAS